MPLTTKLLLACSLACSIVTVPAPCCQNAWQPVVHSGSATFLDTLYLPLLEYRQLLVLCSCSSTFMCNYVNSREKCQTFVTCNLRQSTKKHVGQRKGMKKKHIVLCAFLSFVLSYAVPTNPPVCSFVTHRYPINSDLFLEKW